MSEMDYDQAAELFRDMLDEIYPEVQIGYLSWSPSRVLEEMDPIAFQQGVLEYIDSLEQDDE